MFTRVFFLFEKLLSISYDGYSFLTGKSSFLCIDLLKFTFPKILLFFEYIFGRGIKLNLFSLTPGLILSKISFLSPLRSKSIIPDFFRLIELDFVSKVLNDMPPAVFSLVSSSSTYYTSAWVEIIKGSETDLCLVHVGKFSY